MTCSISTLYLSASTRRHDSESQPGGFTMDAPVNQVHQLIEGFRTHATVNFAIRH